MYGMVYMIYNCRSRWVYIRTGNQDEEEQTGNARLGCANLKMDQEARSYDDSACVAQIFLDVG